MKAIIDLISSNSDAKGSVGSMQTELSPSAQEAIYSSMVAGSFPKTEGSSQQSAYWLAREALDDDRLALVSGSSETHVFYLAVPTRAFSNGALRDLALAAAFPNHPEHEGDGAYVLHLGHDVTVAVIINGSDFKILCNEQLAVLEIIEDEGLRQIECDTKMAWPLKSLRLSSEQAADVATKWAGKVSAVVMALSVLVYAASSIASGVIEGRSKDAISVREHGLAAIIGQVALSSPLAERMAKFQQISSVIVRAGGWLKAYSFKNGEESFVVELPEWVSRDYLDALGPDVKTDLDRVGGVLVVTKGAMKLENK